MRYAQLALMAIGWWSAGLLLSARVVIPCGARPTSDSEAHPYIIPPSPKLNYKCWIGSTISLIFGLLWFWLMGLKDGYVSIDYLVSVIMSAILGALIARILCPK